MPPELSHEPEMALFSGTDGLDVIRRLVSKASDHLSPGGWLGIELSPEQDVLLTYAQHGLVLMQSLKTSLLEASKDQQQEPLLSVNQQQNVTTLTQLIIAFGALPSMLPGVGLPLEKRSKFYSMVQPQEHRSLSVEEKHQRLVNTMLELLELIEEPTISQIVLTKHLGDILAILIQLSSAPLKKPSPEPEETVAEGKFHMTQDKYNEFVKEQHDFKEKLLRIVTKIFPPLTVKYLLLLQSSLRLTRLALLFTTTLISLSPNSNSQLRLN